MRHGLDYYSTSRRWNLGELTLSMSVYEKELLFSGTYTGTFSFRSKRSSICRNH